MRLCATHTAVRALVEQAEALRHAAGDDEAHRWEVAIDEALYALQTWPMRGRPCRFTATSLQGLRWTTVPGFPTHVLFHRYLPGERSVLLIHMLPATRTLADTLAAMKQSG